MNDARCKKCRRVSQKLFLKGDRCYTQKCAMVRRAYAPGVRGKAFRRRLSDYGLQLAEKQKVRLSYGVSERQFKKYFEEVAGKKGNKETLFIQKLEKRLDNVVFRLGWVKSRRLARQVVGHGHILVNGKKVDIPSYQVKKDDLVKIKEKSKKSVLFANLKTLLKKAKISSWLSLDREKLEGKVEGNPEAEDLGNIGEMSMIIEYYSR